VNSALQRARKAVDRRVPRPAQQVELAALGADGRRELVDAFVVLPLDASFDAYNAERLRAADTLLLGRRTA
jgi:hypothetical protein